MTCRLNLVPIVIAEANRQGVDQAIALAVARRESGICQWNADGSTRIGSAGEIGTMQLMPSTATALGVNPYDVQENIRGGVEFLAQLFQRFGSWSLASAAYNWGPDKVARAIQRNGTFPSTVQAYVRDVTGAAIGSNTNALPVAASDSNWKPIAFFGAVALAGVLILTR